MIVIRYESTNVLRFTVVISKLLNLACPECGGVGSRRACSYMRGVIRVKCSLCFGLGRLSAPEWLRAQFGELVLKRAISQWPEYLPLLPGDADMDMAGWLDD